MNSRSGNILLVLALIRQGHAEELANHIGGTQSSMDKNSMDNLDALVDNLVDRSADKLVARALHAASLHDTNLDSTTLGKASKKDIEAVGKTNSAFVFIKPHAVTDEVKKLVTDRFKKDGIRVLSEGAITAEKIDKDMLIDTHYGAIAARAMKQKPSQLAVSQKAQDDFKTTFGMSWPDALKKGVVYNLVDGAKKLDCSYAELGNKYDKLKKGPAGPGTTMLKFGGGFYCGKISDDCFVINGFYASMRTKFTVPGESIYFYEVEWDASSLSWASFRGQVLGGTDPQTADKSSLRNEIFRKWKALGLTSEPNTGNNGLHASASPFEAMAERANWLGVPLSKDAFGRAMLASGVPRNTIIAWCKDPAVKFEGKAQSLFDLLEDLDGRDCLCKSKAIKASNR